MKLELIWCSLEKTGGWRAKKHRSSLQCLLCVACIWSCSPSTLTPDVCDAGNCHTGGWGHNLREGKCFAIDSEILRYGTQGAVLSDWVSHHPEHNTEVTELETISQGKDIEKKEAVSRSSETFSPPQGKRNRVSNNFWHREVN